jgi:GT2 family glycosyltransferase
MNSMNDTITGPNYSFVIPTYKRPDVLAQCLQHIADLDYDQNQIEVWVIDNGEAHHCKNVGMQFVDRIDLRYVVNPKNLGPVGSLNKGLSLSRGKRVIVSNDDALVPKNFLLRCDEVFTSDETIGCIGFRAIEQGYQDDGGCIGQIDGNGRVLGNFTRPTDRLIDVEHIYGFCYAVTRTALLATGPLDIPLLSRSYASGNRYETDQCMVIGKAGFRVVYDGTTGIVHLAKPRQDIGERSPKWRLNEIRNTGYLLLKHYGFAGRYMLSLRYLLLHDLGLRSACLRPSVVNWKYFWIGVRGRISSLYHYAKYLTSRKSTMLFIETAWEKDK